MNISQVISRESKDPPPNKIEMFRNANFSLIEMMKNARHNGSIISQNSK